MEIQTPIQNSKVRDFSSEDSQELIREYTTLIHELIKEFEQLVKENNELRAQLEATKSNNEIENEALRKQTDLGTQTKIWVIFHLIFAFIKSLDENGLKITVRKVMSKIEKVLYRFGK